VRFVPREVGIHELRLVLRTPAREEARTLSPLHVESSARRGFLRPHDAWSFRFDDGTPFRGVGMNLGWEARGEDDSRFFERLHEHPRFHYEAMLGRLAEDGGNFFRTWMCAWNLPVEWRKPSDRRRYTEHDGRFNPTAIERMDEFVELLERTGLYVMLTLDHAGSFIGGQWDLNDYNARNGGPAEDARAFFVEPEARARYKDRLRYLVARWGYSTHIAAWEFFNEIDHVVHASAPPIPAEEIVAWHAEMAAHLRAIDPAARMITTSVSHRDIEGLEQVPGLDFDQRHVYGRTSGFDALLRARTARNGRPYVIGEYAFEWDWTKNFDAFAEDMDAEFSRGLWRGLFAPTPVLPMSWWWEYFDERGTTSAMLAVRELSRRMLAAGDGTFQDAEVSWHGPVVDLRAVRCGSTEFVLIVNESDTAIEGLLALAGTSGESPSAEVFAAESGRSTSIARLPAREPPTFVVTVPAGAIRVCIFTETAKSPSPPSP
jgi:hypothetical protein